MFYLESSLEVLVFGGKFVTLMSESPEQTEAAQREEI